MTSRFIAPGLLALGLIAASQPALAATKKPDTRTAALVAALLVVSPDSLGGRLGYDVTAARTPVLTTAAGHSTLTAQASRDEIERQAYRVWKSTQKS